MRAARSRRLAVKIGVFITAMLIASGFSFRSCPAEGGGVTPPAGTGEHRPRPVSNAFTFQIRWTTREKPRVCWVISQKPTECLFGFQLSRSPWSIDVIYVDNSGGLILVADIESRESQKGLVWCKITMKKDPATNKPRVVAEKTGDWDTPAWCGYQVTARRG